jgi:hypothetical protein
MLRNLVEAVEGNHQVCDPNLEGQRGSVRDGVRPGRIGLARQR